MNTKIKQYRLTNKVSLGRRALRFAGAAVIAAGLFFAPRTAEAGCVVDSPTMCSGGMCAGIGLATPSGPPEMFGVMLAVGALCSPPSGTIVPGLTVVFMATATGASPVCAWDCGSATPLFLMDASDGLPVELMHFGIE